FLRAALEPVAHGASGAERPRTQLVGRDRLHAGELLAELDLAVRANVVREDELVHLRERVGADERDDLAAEPELLAHLAQDAMLRRLVLLEESGDQAVPLFRPSLAAHEQHGPAVLDQRGQNGRGIVIEDVPAGLARTRQPLTSLHLPGAEWSRATRAELHVPHLSSRCQRESGVSIQRRETDASHVRHLRYGGRLA